MYLYGENAPGPSCKSGLRYLRVKEVLSRRLVSMEREGFGPERSIDVVGRPGFRNKHCDQSGRRSGNCCDGEKAADIADILDQIPGCERAHGRGDACHRAGHALGQIESARSRGQIGDDQNRQYANDRARNAGQQLRNDKENIAAREREQCSANGFDGEANEQQWFASALLGMIANPRRQNGDNDLWHDDKARHPNRRSGCLRLGQALADERQHRGVGKLKEHERRSK